MDSVFSVETFEEKCPTKNADVHIQDLLPRNEDLSSSDVSDTDDEVEDTYVKLQKRREKMQQKKRKLIEQLNLLEAAAKVKTAFVVKKKPIASKKKLEAKNRKHINSPRRSLRLQKIDAQTSWKESDDNKQSIFEEKSEEPKRISSEEHVMVVIGFSGDDNYEGNFLDYKSSLADYNAFQQDLSRTFDKPRKWQAANSLSTKKYNEQLITIGRRGCKWKKVVDKRIFSIAINPRDDILLVAAGSKSGAVGIWDLNRHDQNNGIYNWSVHTRPVTNLKFSSFNSNRLYTSSYDGVLRALDLQKSVFEKALIDVDDDLSLSSFDFQNSTCDVIIAGCYSGQIVLCDQRLSATKNVSTHAVHDRVVKSVSFHPLQQCYFATASNDGSVKIFDVRHFHKKLQPLITLKEACKSVDSAYFSPVSGKNLLTTSLDNYIRIYDSSSISKCCMKKAVRHDNHTGRWLSNFRANWHPRREDVIVIGSMNRPMRQIDILNSNLQHVCSLVDEENLQSICSLNCFHPVLDIIAGGNSSGKVFVFGL